MKEFKLPDLGEGLQEAELIEWLVKPGDVVSVDQLIAIVETAKAIVELPSPYAGTISRLCAEEGETVDVGACLIEYDGALAEPTQNSLCKQEPVTESLAEQKSESTSVSVVGQLQEASVNASEEHFEFGGVSDIEDMPAPKIRSGDLMPAPPKVMAIAKKLGILDVLQTRDYSAWTMEALLALHDQSSRVEQSKAAGARPIKLSGARKVMAQTMTKSHQQVPAVTLFDDAVIDAWAADEDTTLRLIRALTKGCAAAPMLNAWFDEEELTIQPFPDVNIGVAVNSAQGLFVPVIRSVESLQPTHIREILNKQKEQVNNRSIKPQKLLGATISLSNFGTLSGRYATPIIVPPQVAILGAGRMRHEALVKNGEIAAAKVLPLSLSFDHRAASGAEAALFLATVIEDLEKSE